MTNVSVMSSCWVSNYDEMRDSPPCAYSFWPTSYDELISGAPDGDPVWPDCAWPDDYDMLILGPSCPIPPTPIFRVEEVIRCPTQWARLKTRGAWHVEAGVDDWISGLISGPLMHDCDLPWGHDGDHVCLCAREYLKPGEEGVLTPPDETIDPLTPTGTIPVSPPPTLLGGPVGARIQPVEVKADLDEAWEQLEAVPTDAP